MSLLRSSDRIKPQAKAEGRGLGLGFKKKKPALRAADSAARKAGSNIQEFPPHAPLRSTWGLTLSLLRSGERGRGSLISCPVSCLRSLVSCLLSPVSSLLSLVSCLKWNKKLSATAGGTDKNSAATGDRAIPNAFVP